MSSLEWAVERWNAEVKHRPLQNIHRRTLDDLWRQVIRKHGGDDTALCGPTHDELCVREKLNFCDMVHDIENMHAKFGVHEAIKAMDAHQLRQFLLFRMSFLQEELDELTCANEPVNQVDALIDLVVVALGTLDAFGVDIAKAWNEVYNKNMQKEPGYNESRPNIFGFPDMIKPEGWTPPNHEGNTGLL
jgi:hypothetical protein